MPDFAKLIVRHGEFGVQAIIESIERHEGKRSNALASLEERWNDLISPNAVEDFHAQGR